MDLLWKLLSWESQHRPTAEQALQSPFFQLDHNPQNHDSTNLHNIQIFTKRTEGKMNDERSCESLSVFLQMQNKPAHLHPHTPAKTPQDVIKTTLFSQSIDHVDIPNATTIHSKKHKRSLSMPLTLAEAQLTNSPIKRAYFSPSISPSTHTHTNANTNTNVNTNVSNNQHIITSQSPVVNPTLSPEISLTFFKKNLTADDFKTPTPVRPTLSNQVAMLSFSRKLPMECDRSLSQLKKKVVQPPSFDDITVNSMDCSLNDVLSPCETPLNFQFSLKHYDCFLVKKHDKYIEK